MRIDITGYVTESLVNYHFTIKVTSDSVECLSPSNFQVSKEVKIFILPYFYPLDDNSKFIGLKEQDTPLVNGVKECLSFSRALSKGDQIECSVFIVDPETRAINRNRRDIETYADFDLWLYPDNGYFTRSESDSRESLKFRKQWRYACINREKCEKITDYPFGNYWWINKNPKMIFPIIWWIQVKTKVSNLWKRFTKQEIGIAIGIIGIVVTIIVAILFR